MNNRWRSLKEVRTVTRCCFMDGLKRSLLRSQLSSAAKRKEIPETLQWYVTASSKAAAQLSICVNACAHSFLCA